MRPDCRQTSPHIHVFEGIKRSSKEKDDQECEAQPMKSSKSLCQRTVQLPKEEAGLGN